MAPGLSMTHSIGSVAKWSAWAIASHSAAGTVCRSLVRGHSPKARCWSPSSMTKPPSNNADA
eukprot:6549151-Pyramimonas_sp.AAC.1